MFFAAGRILCFNFRCLSGPQSGGSATAGQGGVPGAKKQGDVGLFHLLSLSIIIFNCVSSSTDLLGVYLTCGMHSAAGAERNPHCRQQGAHRRCRGSVEPRGKSECAWTGTRLLSFRYFSCFLFSLLCDLVGQFLCGCSH